MAKSGGMNSNTEDGQVHPETTKDSIESSDSEEDDEQHTENTHNTETKDETDNEEGGAQYLVQNSNTKTTTAISLFVESLLQSLYRVHVSDPKEARDKANKMCEYLYRMKLIDESYNMIEFEGVRNQFQRVFHYMFNSPAGTQVVPTWPNNDITNEWSHYYREFDEIEYIAGGGFGQVFRVKHKLDGTEYAVKKIVIRSEGIESVRNYLTEVKTFAVLNHSNIVQYKAAWLELGVATSKNAITDQDYTGSSTSTTNTKLERDNEEESGLIYPDIIASVETSFRHRTYAESSDFEINFETSRHQSYSNSRKKLKKRTKRKSVSEGGNELCITTAGEIQEEINSIKHRSGKWATLYIQMALCPSTLKQWLEKRNWAEARAEKDAALVPVVTSKVGGLREDRNVEILIQIVKGLEYIHSKNIVHHDIKPSNVFMQMESDALLVQLGDFGLACPLQSDRHNIGGGTKLYAAPEQLAGTCDPKSDMYSLGIVTLELASSFQTDMERVQHITELRKGNISPELSSTQPIISEIITKLVSKSELDRPSASALLGSLIKLTSGATNGANIAGTNESTAEFTGCAEALIKVQKLHEKLAEKDREIARLKELLKKAGLDS